MSARVSAALIVRNEERLLEQCLASLHGHVDEVVVVDTGSEDGTREIARSHDARVHEIAWPHDFAAARNFSVEQARGDWILFLDADDRLHVPDGVRLSALLDEPRWAAAAVKVDWKRGFTPGTQLRLFRNDPRIRFRGVVHESVDDAVEAVCRADGLEVGITPVRIMHLGYEGDRTRKHRRNLPLLRRAAAGEPGRPFYWAHLAETLAALGEIDEAVEVAGQAIAISRRLDPRARAVNGSVAYQTLARLLGNRGEDALPVLDEALDVFPHDCDLQFLRARALVEARRYDEALGILDRLVAGQPKGTPTAGISYDMRIFGEFAQDQRGVALLRLGRFADAAMAFEAAAAVAPENPAYHAKAVAMRGRAARAGTEPVASPAIPAR
jgi:glycosyltransferase involved in cell wall biosynthesis